MRWEAELLPAQQCGKEREGWKMEEGSTNIQLAQRLLPKWQGALSPPAIGVQLRSLDYTLNALLMYSLKTGVRMLIWESIVAQT